jgi:hypothetical protein
MDTSDTAETRRWLNHRRVRSHESILRAFARESRAVLSDIG